jgi:hypothetical protein
VRFSCAAEENVFLFPRLSFGRGKEDSRFHGGIGESRKNTFPVSVVGVLVATAAIG